MLRCHECDGAVIEGFELEDLLQALNVGTTRTYYDAFWHLDIEIDAAEWLRFRAKQKVYLARYARQSLIQWDDVDVEEMQQYYDLLVEIIKGENDAFGLEDR